jgi:hypothetical protein
MMSNYSKWALFVSMALPYLVFFSPGHSTSEPRPGTPRNADLGTGFEGVAVVGRSVGLVGHTVQVTVPVSCCNFAVAVA